VLPAAERALGELGFSLALDLGSSSIFLAPCHTIPDPIAVATAVWDRLASRTGRDPRVGIGICVHRGPATVAGSRVEPCALLRSDTWGMPEPLDGVWATAAVASVIQRIR